MKIIIDTNILIPLETPTIELKEESAKFILLCSKYNCQIFIHEASFDDIDRWKNQNGKKIILSRFKKYQILKNSENPTEEFLKRINSRHDTPKVIVDDKLLYAIQEKNADILVSNDNGIYQKSKLINLDPRIYRLEQALIFLEDLFLEKETEIPNIATERLRNININEDIFKSIPNEYPDFKEWFKLKANEGRKTWICRNFNNEIKAIGIYKIEKDFPFLKGKVLKLCTFKVSEDYRGKKLGELLLKTAYNFSILNRCNAIYLTLFKEKQDFLIRLLEEFGFLEIGNFKNSESIYSKYFYIEDKEESEHLNFLDFHIRYFPYFKNNESIRKFIVPIRPIYHERLFPEIQNQISLFPHEESDSNSIKKAYICNSPVKKITSGDILLFYRSADFKSITNIGIAESIIRSSDPNEIASFVGKRTVYQYKEIEKICSRGEALAILFRQIKKFNKFFPFNDLEKRNIKGPIQSIREINEESFSFIFSNSGGNINDNFFADKTQLCL